MQLYVFTADWCHACGEMAKRGDVGQFKSKHSDVRIREVDIDSKRGARLGKAWGLDEVPSFVFVEDDIDEASIGKSKDDEEDEEPDEDTEEVDDSEVVIYVNSGDTLAEMERYYKLALKAEAKRK